MSDTPSYSSSSSETEETLIHNEPNAASGELALEMQDLDATEGKNDTGVHQSETEAEKARLRLHAHHVPDNSIDFSQFFLNMVTEQFGEDLELLRRSTDFKEDSLEILINGLKQGVNIFTPEQRELLMRKN